MSGWNGLNESWWTNQQLVYCNRFGQRIRSVYKLVVSPLSICMTHLNLEDRNPHSCHAQGNLFLAVVQNIKIWDNMRKKSSFPSHETPHGIWLDFGHDLCHFCVSRVIIAGLDWSFHADSLFCCQTYYLIELLHEYYSLHFETYYIWVCSKSNFVNFDRVSLGLLWTIYFHIAFVLCYICSFFSY